MNRRWLHVGVAGWVAWWACVCLSLAAAPVAAESAPKATADDGSRFFGLTNLWEIHLTFDAKAWGQMQSGGGPRRGMGGGRPGLVEGVLRGFLGGGGRRREAGAGEAGGAAVDDSGYPWGVGKVEIQGTAFTNVSVRFKGVSSMVRAPNAFKRPFRVDLERGATNRRFMGVPEFVLNNNVNDATQMREVLAYDAFRRAGLPAPRTAFARVSLTIPGRLTRQHLGLYTVVEPVDRAFLRSRFQTDRGLLM
ncbi:MAG: CotH kinase family protein, partial [Verrucomicrobiota bacterium]